VKQEKNEKQRLKHCIIISNRSTIKSTSHFKIALHSDSSKKAASCRLPWFFPVAFGRLAVSFDVPSDLPSQMKFWLEVKIMVSNTSQMIGWTFLFCWSLILKNWLKHACVVYFVLLDVLCTFGCTLHFHFWKYTVHPKVHWHVGINIFSTRKGKRVHSTSKSTFMYFWMICVLLIVLCTSNECWRVQDVCWNTVGNRDLTF